MQELPWNACTPCPYYDVEDDKCFCHEKGLEVPEDAECFDIEVENETRE